MREIIQVGNIVPPTGKFKNPQRGVILSPAGISTALDTCCGGNREVKIIEIIYEQQETDEAPLR